MLRRSKFVLAGVAAVGLLSSCPAFGQQGLGSQLDAQEQKLAQQEKTCGTVNLAEYAQLLQEASQNKQRAEKAKKKGIPVDEAQVNADLAKAMTLFARAQAAQARHCMLQAQRQPGTTNADSHASLSPFNQRILDAQNKERASVGAPPLKWSEELAQHAMEYARELAHEGRLTHATREGRGIERENLSQGMLGWGSDQMMGNWLKEKRNFKAGIYPDVSATGDSMDVSHYTQMIWPTTTDIGCAMVSGSGFNWLVCRYSPGGNKDGKPVIALAKDLGSKRLSWEPTIKGYYDPSASTKSGGYTTQCAEPSCQVASDYTRPSIDFAKDPSLPQFNTIADAPEKPFNLELKGPYNLEVKYTFGDIPISTMYQETKVEQPDLSKRTEVFNPTVVPDFIIIQWEPYIISVTPYKLSDFVM